MDNNATLKIEHWRQKRKKHLKYFGVLLGLLILFAPTRYKIKTQALIKPQESIWVSSPFNSIIKNIFVNPGQKIKKGQELVELTSPQIDTQLAIAQVDYQIQKIILQDLEASFLLEQKSQAPAHTFKLAASAANLDIAEEKKVRPQHSCTFIWKNHCFAHSETKGELCPCPSTTI